MEIDATSQPPAPPMAPPDGEVTLPEGAELLAKLSDALRRMQQATSEAVDLAGQVQRAGVVEVIESLPLELLLALALDAASDPPNGEQSPPGEPSSRAKQRAQGLERVCSEYLGGGTGRPARTWRSLPRGTPLNRPPPPPPD